MKPAAVCLLYCGRLLAPLVAPLIWVAVHGGALRSMGGGGWEAWWRFGMASATISYLALALLGLPAYWALSQARVPPPVHVAIFSFVGVEVGATFLSWLHPGAALLGGAMGGAAALTYWVFRRLVEDGDGDLAGRPGPESAGAMPAGELGRRIAVCRGVGALVYGTAAVVLSGLVLPFLGPLVTESGRGWVPALAMALLLLGGAAWAARIAFSARLELHEGGLRMVRHPGEAPAVLLFSRVRSVRLPVPGSPFRGVILSDGTSDFAIDGRWLRSRPAIAVILGELSIQEPGGSNPLHVAAAAGESSAPLTSPPPSPADGRGRTLNR
jgi:hypothetical protein